MAGLYLDTSAPVVADTPIAAPNTVSTAVAHAAQIAPVVHAVLNADEISDDTGIVSGSCCGTFLYGHTQLVKYHSNECDEYVADVTFKLMSFIAGFFANSTFEFHLVIHFGFLLTSTSPFYLKLGIH